MMILTSIEVGKSEPVVIEPVVEPPNTKKVVWFIRHGQSTANVAGHGAHTDPTQRDALLTDLGIAQATSLQEVMRTWHPDHIIVSPLRRAIQTACYAFSNAGSVPWTVNPLCTERWSECQENKGHQLSVLRQDVTLLELPMFTGNQWNTSHDLECEWWMIANDKSRYKRFMHELENSPYNRIVVVCHWGFIKHVFESCAQLDISLSNCNWARTEWICST